MRAPLPSCNRTPASVGDRASKFTSTYPTMTAVKKSVSKIKKPNAAKLEAVRTAQGVDAAREGVRSAKALLKQARKTLKEAKAAAKKAKKTLKRGKKPSAK